MDWRTLLLIDDNENNSSVNIPVICDAVVEGETAEEFYDSSNNRS